MFDRRPRSRQRLHPEHAPIATGRRDQLGSTYVVSDAAKAVLRAIRDEVDNEGIFRSSNARAAALAAVSEAEAAEALVELSRKGLVKLVRRPAR